MRVFKQQEEILKRQAKRERTIKKEAIAKLKKMAAEQQVYFDTSTKADAEGSDISIEFNTFTVTPKIIERIETIEKTVEVEKVIKEEIIRAEQKDQAV